MAGMATRVHGVKTESASLTEARPAPADDASPLDAAQLAEAFALFSRASEELSTAYNALQAQVGQLTERLSVLMGALPAGVLVVDRGGRVVQANRAAEGLFGAGLAGRAWPELATQMQITGTPGEYVLPALAQAAPAVQEQNAGAGESAAPGQTSAGTRPLVEADLRRVALSESELESGAERILLVHDITDTHRMRLTGKTQFIAYAMIAPQALTTGKTTLYLAYNVAQLPDGTDTYIKVNAAKPSYIWTLDLSTVKVTRAAGSEFATAPTDMGAYGTHGPGFAFGTAFGYNAGERITLTLNVSLMNLQPGTVESFVINDYTAADDSYSYDTTPTKKP